MKQLLTEIRQCNLCQAHLPLAAKPILQASTNSKILVVGQAPGLVTHKKGIPFDDKSGDRLRTWLGVTYEQFYDPQLFAIIPMGFCYPGRGTSGDLPPLPLCAETWRAQLLTELKHIKLTIILGRYAIDWHLQSKTAISELAKQWQELLRRNQLVLPHPSPRNNRWLKQNSWFEAEVIPVLQEKVEAILSKG